MADGYLQSLAMFNRNVGRRLKIARVTAGNMSGATLSNLIGIDCAKYSRIELGRDPIFPLTLVRASSALAASTDFLLGISSDHSLDGSEPGLREWLVNAAARQSSGRAALAEKYAAIEAQNQHLQDVITDLIGSTTDLLVALGRVQELNPTEFQDLRAGSTLVAAADECRLANDRAHMKI